MGKEEKIYMGRDNRLRGCLLKFVSKTSLIKLINRPIEKLCPLEIQAEQFEGNPNIIDIKKGFDPKKKQLIDGF